MMNNNNNSIRVNERTWLIDGSTSSCATSSSLRQREADVGAELLRIGGRSQNGYVADTTKKGEGDHYSRRRHPLNNVESSFNSPAASTYFKTTCNSILQQIPAVTLVCLLNLMLSIPFGSAFFPVNWISQESASAQNINDNSISTVFPLPGKDGVGIRMFLFATIICQLVMTFKSQFKVAIGLQMVENIPFYHSFCKICFIEQGFGLETISTLLFLFGFSSVVAGITFFILGYKQWGKLVYYFPKHVLVGCIGGIGIFLIVTALSMTTDQEISFTQRDSWEMLWQKKHLVGVVILLFLILRILILVTTTKEGQPRFPLLAAGFYCTISPLFYVGIAIFGYTVQEAHDAGYFFPRLSSSASNATTALDLWRIFSWHSINWTAVTKAMPTVVSLVAFSLMHVPINIPALSVTTGTDVDMNNELIAHGYSNAFSGLFGGLQNYLTYSNTAAYFKMGGYGKTSRLAVAVFTVLLFLVGPAIAALIPRCMAGTMLLNLGWDLFQEGVWESYGHFDALEYSGIWIITITMTIYGMTPGLIAGIISALLTYAAQTVVHQSPIRSYMSASTLRSNKWNRPSEANAILDDRHHGRSRILIIQLQGHIFFGIVPQLTEAIGAAIQDVSQKSSGTTKPWIIILDFSLVLGIDTSAANAIAKIKDSIHTDYDIPLAIFVTGSKDGFPCESNLSEVLEKTCAVSDLHSDPFSIQESILALRDAESFSPEEPEEEPRHSTPQMSLYRFSVVGAMHLVSSPIRTMRADHICHSLEEALAFAEDVLVTRKNPFLLEEEADLTMLGSPEFVQADQIYSDAAIEQDNHLALRILSNLCEDFEVGAAETLFPKFSREVWKKGDILWSQGSKSDCAKILVRGSLVSTLEDSGLDLILSTEEIKVGAMIGELGLVSATDRLNLVKVTSDHAVLYSMTRQEWEKLIKETPSVARCIDLIVIRYLAHRVQHVSNRVFETCCLPI